MDNRPSYEELAGKLAEMEEVIRALHSQEVDAVVGARSILMLRLREVEEALEISNRRLEAALSAVEGGIYDYTLPLDDTCYHSEGWAKILGYKLEELPRGEIFMDWLFDQVHPHDRPQVETVYRDFVTGGSERLQVEGRLRHKQGQWVWVRAFSTIAERNPDGTARRISGMMIDITGSKKAEEIKDEFIGMVSHELRTPLTVIMGALKVATSEGVSPEDAADMLNDAAESSQELAEILNNLVELSRYQARRLQLSRKKADIARLIRGIAKTENGLMKDHRLLMDIKDGLPVAEVDEVRLRHILRNLIHNAFKYSPPGTDVELSAEQAAGYIAVHVKDYGPGLTPEEQARLFQPFERIDGSKPGLGLGLLVCRRLVEAHGGEIGVESEPGEGCDFWFTLPVENAEG